MPPPPGQLKEEMGLPKAPVTACFSILVRITSLGGFPGPASWTLSDWARPCGNSAQQTAEALPLPMESAGRTQTGCPPCLRGAFSLEGGRQAQLIQT